MSQNKSIKGNFNVWAAILGPLYYIYKTMWKKGLLLSSLILIISGIAQWIFPTASLTWLSIGLNIGIYGGLANIDIERKKRFKETVWKELPPVFNNNWLVIIIFVLSFIFFISTDNGSISEIEDVSIDLVTQVLHNQYDIPLDAVDVMIVNEVEGAENTYDARATLSDSSVINILVEYVPDRDYIVVSIPYEEVLLLY